jgi:uncharacterized membrane protein
MASTTIAFGLILTVLGVAGYFLTDRVSPTALIPAFFGIVLLILGFVARADNLRKHAMHAAAIVGMVGLIGFLGALFSLLRAPMETRSRMANFSQIAMAVLTAVFVLLCVRSFRDARRSRAASTTR